MISDATTSDLRLRPNRGAWGVSVLIHVWLVASWLLLLPNLALPRDDLLETTPDFAILDLSLAGDRAKGDDAKKGHKSIAQPREQRTTNNNGVTAKFLRGAPKRLARPNYTLRARATEERLHVARLPESDPIQAQIIEDGASVGKPDPKELESELARRVAVETQRRREIQAAALSGPTDSSPAATSQGAIGAGGVATGELRGRQILHVHKPIYPPAAIQRHSEGLIVARIKVTPEGSVSDVDLVRSSGDPELDRAATVAFRQWRFSSLSDDSEATDQSGTVRMTFELQ